MKRLFTNFQQVEAFFKDRAKIGIKPGLERVYYLLQKLGDPHLDLQAIHIAGTNGKGSTLHYLKNALLENGYQVGVFTSPSYQGLRGHIYRNHEPISEEDFRQLLNQMYPIIMELDEMDNHPTDFEIMTVLAFLYFKKHVEITLVETGMGGRYDTTNCLKPMLSIITNVDYDHTAFLGETLTEIAGHKAGIIKEQAPVIVGETKQEPLTRIQAEADHKQAPIYVFGQDFSVIQSKQLDHVQQFTWKYGEKHIEVTLKMLGDHQQRNAALAMMALDLINDQGFSIDLGKSLEGIAHTTVPGRFEKMSDHPVIVIDGAHNPASVETFKHTMLNHYPDQKRHLIYAAFKDKDIKPMLETLLPHFETITMTTFDSPRAAKAEDIASLVDSEKIRIEHDWQSLVKYISQQKHDPHHYFITGSLHFITLVRDYYFSHCR